MKGVRTGEASSTLKRFAAVQVVDDASSGDLGRYPRGIAMSPQGKRGGYAAFGVSTGGRY